MQEAVTIKDWYSVWQGNPEQLYEQIQKLITDWFAVEETITEKQAILDVEKTNLEGMKSLLLALSRSSSVVSKHLEDLEGRKAENLKSYQQLIPERDAKDGT